MSETVPTAPPKKPLSDATTQVVVLAFDLVGSQIPNLPKLLEKSLTDKGVTDAIQDALDSFMLKRMTSGNSMNPLNQKDATDLLQGLQKTAGSKVEDAALKQLQATPEYKSLEKAIQDFKAAAKATPLGVFVDKHAGVVYVVGIALVVAGAAALFVTKSSNGVVNLAVDQLKGKPFPLFKVGKFSFQGQLLAFQPDKQQLGLGLGTSVKLEKVQITVNIGVIASGATVQTINGSVVIKTGDINLGFKATDSLATRKINLGITLGLDDGPLKSLKIGVGAELYNGKVDGGTLEATMKTSYGNFGMQGTAGGKETKGLATWTLPF